MFKALARLPGGRPSFGLGIVVVDLIADAVIVGSLLWGWGIAAAVYGAAMRRCSDCSSTASMPWPTAAAILAVAAWRNRPAAACSASRWRSAPPSSCGRWSSRTLLIVPWRGRRSLLALAAFGGAAAALGGLALWIAGANAITQVLTFRGATGWQVESLAGSLVHLVDTRSVRLESGAWRVGTINHLVSTAMFLAAAPICLWASWRGARLDRVGAGWIASVTSLLLLSALFSAQYVIWLAPAAAIAWVEGDKALAVLTAIAILLTQFFWMHYGGVLDSHLTAMLLVVLRNVIMIALALSRDHAALAGSPKVARLTPSSPRSREQSSELAWQRLDAARHTTGRQRKNQIASDRLTRRERRRPRASRAREARAAPARRRTGTAPR